MLRPVSKHSLATLANVTSLVQAQTSSNGTFNQQRKVLEFLIQNRKKERITSEHSPTPHILPLLLWLTLQEMAWSQLKAPSFASRSAQVIQSCSSTFWCSDSLDTRSLYQYLPQTDLFWTQCVYTGHVLSFKNRKVKLLLLYARVIKKINLILHKNRGNISNFSHNFFLPGRDCFEGLSVSCRKHKNTSLGSYKHTNRLPM